MLICCDNQVLEDANIKEAAQAIVFGALANSGQVRTNSFKVQVTSHHDQVCMSTERVIVHESIAENLISSIKEIASALKAGDTSVDSNCQLGPLVSESSARRIIDAVKKSQDSGAQVILGNLTRDKAIVQPHILTGVKPGMSLWEEESFGPGIIHC